VGWVRGNLCVSESSRHELSTLSVHGAKAEGLCWWLGCKWHYISVVLYWEVEDSDIQTRIQAYRLMYDCLGVGTDGTHVRCRKIAPPTPPF
jgi:hypothetical protein